MLPRFNMELNTNSKPKKRFGNFDETYPICSFALAIAFLYPNRSNALKRAVIFSIILCLNGGQLFWFTLYSYKCFVNLDIYNLSRNMTLAVVVLIFLIKTYYAIIFATHKFAPVLHMMTKDFLKANDLDESYQKIYEDHIRMGKVGEKSWLLIPTILSSQFPVYAGICMAIESIQTDDYKRHMIHDMDLIFLEHIQNESPYFQCIFAYNCIQCIVIVPNYCGFDGSFCIATTHLCMKLKLMTLKIRNAFKDARNPLHLRLLIIDAIKDHQEALHFHARLQDVYGPWLFTIFLLTSFMISFNLYQIYLLGHIDIKYTMFMIVGVLHIYLPCHYASVLTKVGDEIVPEIYDVPWEQVGDTAVTKMLMVMITRAQKELVLTGYGVVVFNMELFKSIMQTSYSFFTLITA